MLKINGRFLSCDTFIVLSEKKIWSHSHSTEDTDFFLF